MMVNRSAEGVTDCRRTIRPFKRVLQRSRARVTSAAIVFGSDPD